MKIGPTVKDNSLELVTHDELKDYEWKRQNPAQNMSGTENESKWVFDSVPDGFRLSVHESREGANSHQVEHFVFTDGFATMSVYIEKAVAEKMFEGESQMGAIHAYGTQSNGFQITAVGEVPAQTVKTFALSAKYKQE
jgi:sigma-E factor negative regulatory protein RseB